MSTQSLDESVVANYHQDSPRPQKHQQHSLIFVISRRPLVAEFSSLSLSYIYTDGKHLKKQPCNWIILTDILKCWLFPIRHATTHIWTKSHCESWSARGNMSLCACVCLTACRSDVYLLRDRGGCTFSGKQAVSSVTEGRVSACLLLACFLSRTLHPTHIQSSIVRHLLLHNTFLVTHRISDSRLNT